MIIYKVGDEYLSRVLSHMPLKPIQAIEDSVATIERAQEVAHRLLMSFFTRETRISDINHLRLGFRLTGHYQEESVILAKQEQSK